MAFGNQNEKNTIKKEVDSFLKNLNKLQKELHQEIKHKPGLEERIMSLSEKEDEEK